LVSNNIQFSAASVVDGLNKTFGDHQSKLVSIQNDVAEIRRLMLSQNHSLVDLSRKHFNSEQYLTADALRRTLFRF